MTVHPIEAESYRILGQRVDLSGWAPGPAAVAARIVHATAEPGLVADLVVEEAAVAAGVAALRSGAAVLCDVEMVRAGVSGVPTLGARTEGTEQGPYPSRTAAAMAALVSRHREGAVVVVGCAPTALAVVNRMLGAGSLRPALVVGTPVGFVGAAQAKEELLAASTARGIPAIVLRGERGGAAVAAAAVNALVRLAAAPSGGTPSQSHGTPSHGTPSGGHEGQRQTDSGGGHGPGTGSDGRPGAGCLVIGHGTRSPRGADELRGFAGAVAAARPEVATEAGFIEFVDPGLDDAIDALVAAGPTTVVAVPLVLLGAGHMKDDGPAALARARGRHPGTVFTYARDLGVHPDVLAVVADRAGAAAGQLPGGTADAVVLVGRGSTDPDANADLAKAARLLADGRGLGGGLRAQGPPVRADSGRTDERTAAGQAATGQAATGPPPPPPLGLVAPAFVSLAEPGVPAALDQCALVGARRIAVVPYFLFEGLLVERISDQVTRWAHDHPDCTAVTAAHMGIDPRLVALAWHRYDEALGGPVHMNCDGCLYRTPLPGYEHRAPAPG